MGSRRIDAVIESVRFDFNGRINLVRGYLKRDRVYTDLVLIPRVDLIKYLKSGKQIWTGTRKEFLASTFLINERVQFSGKAGQENIYSVSLTVDRDNLPGVPIF